MFYKQKQNFTFTESNIDSNLTFTKHVATVINMFSLSLFLKKKHINYLRKYLRLYLDYFIFLLALILKHLSYQKYITSI